MATEGPVLVFGLETTSKKKISTTTSTAKMIFVVLVILSMFLFCLRRDC